MEEKTKTQQSLRKPRENSHFSPSSSSCNLYLSRAPVSVSFIFHFPDLCPEILPVLADNPGLRNGTLFRPASPFVVTSHQRNTNNFSEHYFTFPQLFFLLPFLLLLRIYPISHELDPLSVIIAVVIAVSGRVASRRSGLCLTVAFVGFLVGLVGVEDAGGVGGGWVGKCTLPTSCTGH